MRKSFTSYRGLISGHREEKKNLLLRDGDDSCGKLNRFTVWIIAMLLIFNGLPSFGQVLKVYPTEINAATTGCNGLTTRTFRIENIGDALLNYTNSFFPNVDDNLAGNTINTFDNLYYSVGIVKIGDLIYAANYDYNTVDKYSLSSQSVVGSFEVTGGQVSSMTYDGQYLWVALTSGVLKPYTLTGELVAGSLMMPDASYPMVTYDGQDFIYADGYRNDPTIYRMDHTGKILNSYATEGQYLYIYGLTYDPTNGSLWIIDWYFDLEIRQLALTGNVVESVNSITNVPASSPYAILRDAKGLWLADWNGTLYLVNDGLGQNANWLTLSPSTGSLSSSSATTVTATISAVGLGEGTHSGTILIGSNDAEAPSQLVSCTLNVEGGIPSIGLSASAFNFGKVFLPDTYTDTLWIRNTGCDTLKVTDISGTTSEFSVDQSAFFVMPFDSVPVLIGFSPASRNSYSATLTIVNNDANATVSLSATYAEQPILAVDTKSLDAAVNCGGTATKSFTVTNNAAAGAADLTYNTNVMVSSMGYFNSNIAGKILKTYTGSTTGEERGMVYVGKYLYIIDYDNNRLDQYDPVTQTLVNRYSLPFNPYGIAYDGKYLWIVNTNDSRMYAFNFDGTASGLSIDIPFANPVIACDGKNFIIAERWSNNPTIYKIDHSGNTLETYSSNIGYLYDFTWVPEHVGGNLWAMDGGNILKQINLADGLAETIHTIGFPYETTAMAHDGKDLLCADENSEMIYRVEDGIDDNIGWLTLSKTNGTLEAQSQSPITATFNGQGVGSGIHTADLIISSNDPTHTADTIKCSLTVTGSPSISLPVSSVSFGTPYIGNTVTDTLWVLNSGCDTLKVTGISGTTSEFTLTSDETFEVMPYDSAAMMIHFIPAEVGSKTATLTISNNDAEATVGLSGTGIAPPEMAVSMDTLKAEVNCGGSTAKTFSIQNNPASGTAALSFANKVVYFDDSKAGTILNTYNNAGYGNVGMVFVGDYLYITNYDNSTVSKYDIRTQSVINSFSLSYEPMSITYDGQHLWITYYGVTYLDCFDLNGNRINRYTIPVNNPDVTFDGQYLIAAPFMSSNPTFYKIDLSGTIVGTYFSQVDPIYQITWNPKTNSLWTMTSAGELEEINLSNGSASKGISYSAHMSTYAYSIAHNGKDMYVADWNGYLYQEHDGLEGQSLWLSLSENTGTVAAGSSSVITATFNGSEMSSGTYKATILVSSNDPANSLDTVVCIMTIKGNPVINVPASLGFGEVYSGATVTDSILVTNTGCDTLKISDITLSAPEFSVDETAFDVLPYEAVKVAVHFTPTAVDDYSATMTIANNDQSATVNLTGSRAEPPVMKVEGASITDTLNCSGVTAKTFTISNTGTSALAYHANVFTSSDASLQNVLTKLDAQYADITSIIPNVYNFELDGSGNYISDGGNDMYDGGNYLSTNYVSDFVYSEGVITSNGAMGSNGSYFTRKYNGLFVLAADLDAVDYFMISGDNGADGGGNVSADVLTLKMNDTIYYGFLKRVYNAGDPSINHLIIVKKSDILDQNFAGSTNDDGHTITGLSGSTRMYYLLYAGSNGYFIDNTDAMQIMSAFLNIVTPEINWISLSPNPGTVAAGNSQTVTATFDAGSLNSGVYKGGILVSSNDPENRTDTLSFSITVAGEPVISLSRSAVNFNNLVVENTSYTNLTISNTGCEALAITDITSSSPAFYVNTTSMTIMPGDSRDIRVYFTPSDKVSYYETLTISNNDEEKVVTLTGAGVLPGIVDVVSDTPDGYYSEGAQVEMTLRYNAVVSVSGTPRIALNTNPGAFAFYNNGMPSYDLTFNYTVGADENSADLDYASVDAVELNGGAFEEAYYGYDVDTVLPDVGTFAAAHNIIIDNIHPTVALSSTAAATTGRNPIPVTITFSEAVNHFTLADISVDNGTASDLLTENNITWTVGIIPTTDGTVTVNVYEGAATDLAGNTSIAADPLSRNYDHLLPALTMSSNSSDPTSDSPIIISVVSNVSVTGLDLSDFTVTNGTAAGFTVVSAGTQWTIAVTPAADGEVTVSIPAQTVVNAQDNSNPEPSEFSITYRKTPQVSSVTVDNIGMTTADAHITCNKDAMAYYVVLESTANAPTADQIISASVSPVASGSIAVDANAAETINITGLTPNTDYVIYVVARDQWETVSEVSSHSFTSLLTGIDEEQASLVRIYPNPVKTHLTIKLGDNERETSYGLYSLTGAKLSEGNITGKEMSVDMSEYPAGVYILRITSGNEQMNFKVAKK